MYTRVRADNNIVEQSLGINKKLYTLDSSAPSFLQWGTKTTWEYDKYLGTVTNGSEREMTDVVIPNFKERSAKGEIFNNPMNSEVHEYVDNIGWLQAAKYKWSPVQSMTNPPSNIPYYKNGWEYDCPVRGSHFFGSPRTANYATASELDTASLIDQAVTQAHANVDVTDAQVLATAGEAQETAKFIVDSLRRCIKILRAVKQADLKYLRKQISRKELANRYMEYRYAIRPMVMEANDYVSLLSEPLKQDRYTFRGYATAHATVADEGQWDDSTKTTYTARETKRVFTVRAGVLSAIESITLPMRLGLDKPFDAAWELVPFGHIADWFFNIGQTIASWTPNYGIKELASWYSTTDVVEAKRWITGVKSKIDPNVYNGGHHYRISNALVAKTSIYKTRVPNPQRAFLPRLKINLDGWKLIDLAIIAKQLTSTRGNRRQLNLVGKLG